MMPYDRTCNVHFPMTGITNPVGNHIVVTVRGALGLSAYIGVGLYVPTNRLHFLRGL